MLNGGRAVKDNYDHCCNHKISFQIRSTVNVYAAETAIFPPLYYSQF